MSEIHLSGRTSCAGICIGFFRSLEDLNIPYPDHTIEERFREFAENHFKVAERAADMADVLSKYPRDSFRIVKSNFYFCLFKGPEELIQELRALGVVQSDLDDDDFDEEIKATRTEY